MDTEELADEISEEIDERAAGLSPADYLEFLENVQVHLTAKINGAKADLK